MAEIVFVDTSAWVGLFVDKDQYHAKAIEAFESLTEDAPDLVTTDYIIAETVARIRRQASHKSAAGVWDRMEGGDAARVVEVDTIYRRAARKVFGKYDQLELSLVDCVSFVVMEDLGIRAAFTFDDDFRRAGFITIPRKK
jgi:predicted nucleic acid-binding protein